jgi:aryl-alcohol dehydrogenase-like predicted oxidoreductase
MGMSQSYGNRDDRESSKTLRHALDQGVNFLDTADIYGEGHNEAMVGAVVRERRHEVVLATKFGFVTRDSKLEIDGSPEYVRQACDASLRRLRLEVIDLFYLHRVDPRIPIEDTIGAMAELARAGKVRFLGLSEVSAATLRSAHRIYPITAVQSEYSLVTRDPEQEILPACRELGVAMVPFCPLGRGLLTGQIQYAKPFAGTDARHHLPRFQGKNLRRNLELARRFESIAAEKGCRPPQLALAWLLAKGADLVPIPGAKKRGHLDENIAALTVELTASDLERIETAMPPGAVAGERHNEDAMRFIDR